MEDSLAHALLRALLVSGKKDNNYVSLVPHLKPRANTTAFFNSISITTT